jgi:hypothetical protein
MQGLLKYPIEILRCGISSWAMIKTSDILFTFPFANLTRRDNFQETILA